jgi:branched-chain amino acid transport system ATP-binding protein
MNTVLRAEHLSRQFDGVRAVHDVSFHIAAGEILAMIGPNGAGKSTCFNLVGGQIRPDAGRVWLGAEEITALPPVALAARGVARTFQIGAVFASMTVRENLQTALSAHAGTIWRFWRAARDCEMASAEALLAQVGLADQAERPAAALAYGDLKRLELALALATEPRLLLMDEPTAGMEAGGRTTLMRLLRDLATQRQLAVLFTEHDMSAVFAVADRVLVLDRGAVLAEGSPDEIRANPAVRAAYLGE